MKRYALFFLLLSAAFLTSVRASAQVVVIANPDLKATSISKADLRDLFTGAASSLKDGSHATPVLLKAGPAHESFLTTYIGKNDTAFKAGWRSLVFSGQASMPKSLDTEAAIVEFVAKTAGAVGYIRAETPHGGVRVLTVH